MTTWQLNPTYLRLADGTYLRVLLIFDTSTRRFVGAGVAESDGDIEDVLRGSIAKGGLPDVVRQLPNPLFDDLTGSLTRLLAEHGFRHGVEDACLDEDLVWVLESARHISKAAERTKPATRAELADALHNGHDTVGTAPVKQ
jgi:hypothetical protein